LRKKILILEPYLDLLGGSERMAFEVAKGLAKKGWEIHVGCEREGLWRGRYGKFARGFHSIRLPIGNFRRPFELAGAWFRLHRLAQRLGIQVIFSSHAGHLLTAAMMEKLSGVRSCFHLGLMGAVANAVSGRWAIRQISAGVAPSEKTSVTWREIGWPKDRLQVMPNWIDWEEYRNQPSKEEARKNLERDSGVKGLSQRVELKVVAYVGRLVEEKGIEVLLKAWRMGLAENPDAVMIIAGKGKPEYEAKVRGMMARNVRFLGQVEDPKMVYRASELTVVPSLVKEVFGLVPLEAVACGSLPLVSDRGFLPELVGREAGELVHQAGRADELSCQMVRWLSRETASVTSRLRNFGAEKFSAAKGVQAYQDILESFLAR
jgi:glycosyltransferase involved in cell wall biosynthesis